MAHTAAHVPSPRSACCDETLSRPSGSHSTDPWFCMNCGGAHSALYVSDPICRCGNPIAQHVGGKPCVYGEPSAATKLHDLPIFGRFWAEDGRDRRA